MRILLTCDPMIPVPPSGYGGIERIVDGLARELRGRGFEVGLVAHPDSTCPVDAFWAWPGRDVRDIRATVRNIAALVRCTREFRPDVIHSFARLAYLAGVLGSPTPKIMSYQRQARGKQIRVADIIAGSSLQFTACSHFIAEEGRMSGGTWHAIPNFVDTRHVVYESDVAPDAPLLFLSRVESIKGPDLAIAMAKAARRPLVIAGNHATSGPEYEFWRKEVLPHIGRDGISYVGEVGDEQKFRLLRQSAALVVPIRWDEPFGIVFVEALATGTPVIACKRGALPEIVTPGVTGWFVSSVADGAEAIGKLNQIARSACRRRAEEEFSTMVVANRYCRLYAKVREIGR